MNKDVNQRYAAEVETKNSVEIIHSVGTSSLGNIFQLCRVRSFYIIRNKDNDRRCTK